jgi:hypothetical protein
MNSPRFTLPWLVVLALVLVLVWAPAASAQISFETAGTRAMGMAGAFVAVADDASSVHWNPAGLVYGDPVGMTVGWDRLRFGDPKLSALAGASQDSNKFTSVATWPFAISYGHFHSAQVVGTGLEGAPIVDSLRVHHIGFSIAQTLLEGLVVGTTVKYLRGQAINGEVTGLATGEALDQAMERKTSSDGAFDLDIGVMGELGPVRVGYTLKNVTQPTFVGNAGFAIQLKRRSRLGVAVLPVDGLTLAFDVDLDTADPLVGLRRMMALGGEARLGSSVALRSGVRWSRDGERRPIAALGASLRLRKGFWLDGYATYSRYEDRGFGVAFRAGS